MDLIEFNTHSFVVKVWREDLTEDHPQGRWRGHITHVPSGERRYLKNLNGIVGFMLPYLEAMGVRLDAFWRLRSWLARDSEMPNSRPEQVLNAEE